MNNLRFESNDNRLILHQLIKKFDDLFLKFKI